MIHLPTAEVKLLDNKGLRLFACACADMALARHDDQISRRVVGIARRYANGDASRVELANAEMEIFAKRCPIEDTEDDYGLTRSRDLAWATTLAVAIRAANYATLRIHWCADDQKILALLRSYRC